MFATFVIFVLLLGIYDTYLNDEKFKNAIKEIINQK